MPAFDVVRRWKGRAAVDRGGAELGAIVEVYYDEETDQPGWALVATAAFGPRLVPVMEAEERGGLVQVPLDRSTVAGAPGMEPGGRLWPQEVAALYAYYGLDYSGATAEDAEEAEPPAPRPFEPLRTVGAGPVARRRPL